MAAVGEAVAFEIEPASDSCFLDEGPVKVGVRDTFGADFTGLLRAMFTPLS